MLRFMESSYTYTPPLSPIDGEVDMYDDPPDAPWRRRVESKIRRAVEWGFPERVRPYRTGFMTYDISWYAGTLDVVVMILPGPSPPAAKLLSLQDLKRFRQLIGDMLDELEDKEQLYVTRNHQIVVSSLPLGAERRLLCCRKDFNLFAGSECTFMFDRQASAVLNSLSEETAALLLEECAETVAAARRSKAFFLAGILFSLSSSLFCLVSFFLGNRFSTRAARLWGASSWGRSLGASRSRAAVAEHLWRLHPERMLNADCGGLLQLARGR
ncbi:putative transmembrane protein [Toxoplasma gondii VAND]|uniref:Putative transmembrane protein n=1 Tax=Toxoplasma gondii VAND TaxID=933077 RepID=A0A086QES1_TOXGO|nr:putative transmembrane protein [Toxoplasma gondii VAND]